MVADVIRPYQWPGTFICFMNQMLKPYIGKFVVVCFDDVLVHNQDEVDHVANV